MLQAALCDAIRVRHIGVCVCVFTERNVLLNNAADFTQEAHTKQNI